MFAHATQGRGVKFAQSEADPAASDCTADAIKVFALTGIDVPSMGQAGQTLRLAAINKDASRACRVTLSVAGSWGDGLAVWLLPNPSKGMMSKNGITWRSQHYDGTSDGVISGPARMQPLRAANAAGGARGGGVRTEYTIERLPPGRAVVVTAVTGP